MVYAFGGSAEYKGRDLKAAHYNLVTMHGLNTDHFDMVAGHFQATLVDLKIDQVRLHVSTHVSTILSHSVQTHCLQSACVATCNLPFAGPALPFSTVPLKASSSFSWANACRQT